MGKQFDIICFSISRVDAPISSPGFSLAKEFARSHRVFYIEHPHSWKDLVNEWNADAVRKRRNAWFANASPGVVHESGVTVITPPLTLPINFLPEGKLYDLFFRVNDEIMFNLIRRIKRQFNIDQYLFINFFDPFFFSEFPQDIRPWKSVYQSMDAISEVKYTARHGVRLEDRAIRNADITLCTSSGLFDLHKSKSGHVYLLPNGVDDRIFSQSTTELPQDMNGNGKPLVGYVGSIEYRMDFSLLLSVVRSLPAYEFRFIGPVAGETESLRALQACANVRFLGPRKFETIPSYLAACDALIIPFKCDNLTAKIYPLKLNEYLMAGKPVIATKFSNDISTFVPHVYIAEDAASFATLIGKAVSEDDQSKRSARIACAQENTWEKRAARFFEIVEANS